MSEITKLLRESLGTEATPVEEGLKKGRWKPLRGKAKSKAKKSRKKNKSKQKRRAKKMRKSSKFKRRQKKIKKLKKGKKAGSRKFFTVASDERPNGGTIVSLDEGVEFVRERFEDRMNAAIDEMVRRGFDEDDLVAEYSEDKVVFVMDDGSEVEVVP